MSFNMHEHSELIYSKRKLFTELNYYLHYYESNKFIVYISSELYDLMHSSTYQIFRIYLNIKNINLQVTKDIKMLNHEHYYIYVDETDKFINDFNDIFI